MPNISHVAKGTLAGLIAFLFASWAFYGEPVGPFWFTAESILLGAFILTMGWLVATYSSRNLRGQARQGRYAGYLGLAIVALWLAVVANPVLLTAVGWTVSGLAVAALVAHAGTPTAISAGRRVAGRLLVGDAALWAAIVVLVLGGTSSRSDIGEVSWVVPALMAVAGIVRSALVPAWRWLPLTAEAPSPVSALLHAGVVNGLGLLAVLYWGVFSSSPMVLLALVVVGGVTAVLGTAAMRVRPDVKGKLASSTSAQMGYMTVQVGLGLPAFAMLHLIGHGFYKGWLFLRAGGAPQRPRVPDLSGVKAPMAIMLAGISAVVIGLGVNTWVSRPVVDLVPLAIAGVTATFALCALVWPDVRTAVHSTARGRAWSMVATVAGLLAYVVALGVWVRIFEMPGVWSGVGALTLTAAVLAFGSVGMYAVSRNWLSRFVSPLVVDTATRIKGQVPAISLTDAPAVDVAVDAASSMVGPMWPINSAVAVNPLSGLQAMAFSDAAEVAARTWGARAHMDESQYLQAMTGGRFTRADLIAAADGFSLPNETVADFLAGRAQWELSQQSQSHAQELLAGLSDEQIAQLLHRPAAGPRTLGEQAGIGDKVSGLANAWTALANSGQPFAGGLWKAFQTDVQDLGLRGLSSTVRSLPEQPAAAVAVLLHNVIPTSEQVGYLSRLVAKDPGWVASLKQRDPGLIVDLLAIRVSFDVLASAAADGRVFSAAEQTDREWAVAEIAAVNDLLGVNDARDGLAIANELQTTARVVVWQRAWEQRYRNHLMDQVSTRSAHLAERDQTPTAHVIMCIDVRSERFRRHLEARGDYDTHGFAGFFGVALRHETASGSSSDQCPVLLKPAFTITENDSVSHSYGTPTAIRGGLVSSTARPASAFAVAEGLGALAGLDALAQTAAPGMWGRWRDRLQPAHRGELHLGHLDVAGSDEIGMGMTVEQRTSAAAGMLRALGLVENLAPVILVTGHAAKVENNAFAAAYDCGACGGNGGYVNARVMAAVVNDPRVRRRLAEEHGITIPDTTVAVPAWHNTTTDEVLIEEQDVPDSHREKVGALRADLVGAGVSARAERMAELPGVSGVDARAAARRSADWAEPQPEWGLAGNAAFVIGPRAMTKGLNLSGRVFLHSYEPGLDVDGSTLELLLTAPMVVTQWINNQYYFATVDPQHFGAGDKTTHNVVGDYAVFSGAGGDLRVGLPWQGVFREQPLDQDNWMHEPLRLQVVVYADPADILRVLDQHPDVGALVANEWIALAAIEPGTGEAFALDTDLQWRPWLAHSNDQAVFVMSKQG